MPKFGKWIGGGLGFALGGPIGGLLGFLVGSAVDDSGNILEPYTETARPGTTAQGDFGMSLLVLIAAVMKADKKVVRAELDYVKDFFVRQFGPDSARQALLILRDLLKKDIPINDVCVQIRMNMDYSSRLQLIHLLFNLSQADSSLHPLELSILQRIASSMGISENDFLSIRNMFVPEVDSAYKILEIDPSASDDDVKKAYRKMAKLYHPDKVGHLGEEFRKTADEKFKAVNEAYERIKRERNIP
ncbi:MAG TPA: TerB family tellurite resistance protein [Bacteroidales bacterium]|nr:TerB family tellurite resistance protein [Bacteroidales bacterium]